MIQLDTGLTHPASVEHPTPFQTLFPQAPSAHGLAVVKCYKGELYNVALGGAERTQACAGGGVQTNYLLRSGRC
jgi:hypothetical protein